MNGILIGYAVVVISLVAGWITNIINIIGIESVSAIGGYEILEIIGIFVAPLGGVLGIISWF